MRAQIYSGIGKYEEALNVSELGCHRFPEDANLALTKLKVLVEMSKDQEAADLIEKMKNGGQFDKVMKEAVIQESILFLRKQDTETTLSILQKANTALGGDADIVYLIMDIYGKSENYEKTMETANLLIGMNPGEYYESTARYFHAHSLDKMGKDAEAKAEYRKLTSLLRKATINNPSFMRATSTVCLAILVWANLIKLLSWLTMWRICIRIEQMLMHLGISFIRNRETVQRQKNQRMLH